MHKKKKASNAIPSSVVKRLTRYLTLVQNLDSQGEEWVSSKEVAEQLGLTSSTVRQDLSHVDFSGISKKGYEVAKLLKVLRKILGADKEWHCVVIGAGNLGTAIANHRDIARRGFVICGLFDIDPERIGKKEGELTVMHTSEIASVVRKSKVEVGIIAVPASAAQDTADALVEAGVKGLLNLSVTHISVPPGVSVIGTRMVTSLLALTHSIMSS
jgi:redox-sensing transcriptional repressor